jgi:hypothetical protein
MDRDPRYDLIKEKIAKGNIKSFNEIFFFIPKTIVANDLGKKVNRFNEMMEHVGKFTLDELSVLARNFKIPMTELLTLVHVDFERQVKKRHKADQS